MASFSSRTVETLIDLVEIKLSCLDVTDRDDRAELRLLKQALAELSAHRQPARRAMQSDALSPAI
jgi:hypothetical protein